MKLQIDLAVVVVVVWYLPLTLDHHHRATLMITCYRVVILHETLMTTLQCTHPDNHPIIASTHLSFHLYINSSIYRSI